MARQVEARTTADSAGTAPADPAHGDRESNLGRRTDRQRIAAEARPAGFPADRAQVHAEATAGSPARRSALVDVPAQSCARAIVACDFFVAVTATFRLLYVFVVIEHGSRRLVRVAVAAHPTAAWTLHQLREVVGFDHASRYLIHDRGSIFARSFDESIGNLGLTALKSPPHSPRANAICERVIGTIRRECLDWLIPLSESHLRSILRSWVGHYNHGRPHMALGPGVPDPPSDVVPSAKSLTRHRSASALRCASDRCWAACITNICWRPRRCDRVIAEHRCSRLAE
jgi:transposase InsO family protein